MKDERVNREYENMVTSQIQQVAESADQLSTMNYQTLYSNQDPEKLK